MDEERRPGDRPEGGLRMSERRSREQKAEHRSRLGRIVARCGAVAVKTRLRTWSQHTHEFSLNTVTDSVSTPSRIQSQHCHGFSSQHTHESILTTITDSVLRERNTPNHRSRLVSFVARVWSRIHVRKHRRYARIAPPTATGWIERPTTLTAAIALERRHGVHPGRPGVLCE